jgi:hypothetical protein
MPSLNCASINFGGINASKLEFADFSNPEVKAFFQKVQNDFDGLRGYELFKSTSLRSFIQNNYKNPRLIAGVDSSVIAFTNFMFDQATRFMVENMDREFLMEMARESNPKITTASFRAEFDLGEISVGSFVNHVLVKDKGIGGFDQISAGRPTNIGANLNAFLMRDSETGEWVFTSDSFLYELKKYYTQTDGISFTRVSNAKNYKDMFLKGRKEGVDGKSARNYYTFYGEHDATNGDYPTEARNTLFHMLGNIVMMVYDLISMELIIKNGPIPRTIPEKPSPEEVTENKARIITNMIFNGRGDAPDVVFLTECIPDAFATHHDDLMSYGYTVHYGPELDGVCNTIIYSIVNDSGLLELKEHSVNQDVYQSADEYKEVPLHLSTHDESLHLISYHANGKGVTVNQPLPETSFYSWLNSIPGCVILGGDLNMDFKKTGDALSAAFELGNPTANAFSCFKQRTPLQAQYDKAGVFDTKYCDYIITRGCMRSGTKVVRTHITGDNCTLERLDCAEGRAISKEELVVPNADFPFEHYMVVDTITPVYPGCDFFKNISSWLSWMDYVVNWFNTYN